jgi:uncharacterized protein
VLRESGEAALLAELADWNGYVSSTLLAVESIRACSRRSAEDAREARRWLEGVSLLPIDDLILNIASELGPTSLRSLDALHLATALSVRDEVGLFVTYDERLAEAADNRGLPVAQPA